MDFHDEYEKRNSGRLFREILIFVLSLLAILGCLAATFGWLARNTDLFARFGAQLEKPESEYELAAVGDDAGLYEDILERLNVATPGTAIVLDGRNGDSTEDKKTVYWDVSTDSNLNNVGTDTDVCKLEPGSSGKISFYLISNKNGAIDVTLKLSLQGYNENLVAAPDEINEFLGGHICFFTGYSGGRLSGLLEDRTIRITDASSEVGKKYEYTLYWYWPERISDVLRSDQTRLDSAAKTDLTGVILDDAANIASATDLSPYNSRFFHYSNESIVAEAVTAENLSGLSADDPVAETIDIFYNQADQRIGINTDYVLLVIGEAGEDEP